MSVEAVAAAAAPSLNAVMPQAGGGQAVSLTDLGGFEGAMAHAATSPAPLAGTMPDRVGPALKGMATSLDSVDGEARQVSEIAQAASLGGKPMTPGQVIQLSMRCSEFMFHCQLTSNIANRSSDGIQQLFRQQS